MLFLSSMPVISADNPYEVAVLSNKLVMASFHHKHTFTRNLNSISSCLHCSISVSFVEEGDYIYLHEKEEIDSDESEFDANIFLQRGYVQLK